MACGSLYYGGLEFAFRSDAPTQQPLTYGVDEAGFRHAAEGAPGATRVDVELCPVPADARAMDAPLFDAGAWRLGVAGAGRWIEYVPPTERRPLWRATLGVGGFTQARLATRALSPDGPTSWPFCYPRDMLMVMYRLLGEGVIAHGCGALIDGEVTLFTGRSTAGKSTMAAILQQGGIPVFSDDRVILRSHGDQIWAYGTPWLGVAGVCANAAAPLRRVVLLEKGASVSVRKTVAAQALHRLLATLSVPWYDAAALDLALPFCERLVEVAPPGTLAFARESTAAEVLAALGTL